PDGAVARPGPTDDPDRPGRPGRPGASAPPAARRGRARPPPSGHPRPGPTPPIRPRAPPRALARSARTARPNPSQRGPPPRPTTPCARCRLGVLDVSSGPGAQSAAPAVEASPAARPGQVQRETEEGERREEPGGEHGAEGGLGQIQDQDDGEQH